ncbi:polyprotein [Fisavirus 1]|uniref:polyprotein n=1 Tax=Fisavirus 1 TaxID=1574287 RepID=UPI00053FF67B|nr:polyprotein [Fisavirus 1]AIY32625.1 polyprotein [Fisavirus 1]
MDSDSSFYSEDDEEVIRAKNTGKFWYVIRPLFCKHQRNYVKCPCMYQMQHENMYYFDIPMLNDLSSIVQELRMVQLAKLNGRDPKELYRFHRATIVALTTKDKRLLCDPTMNRGRFLSLLYELREAYDNLEDFGQRNEQDNSDFEAQGLGDIFQKIINGFTKATKVAYKTIESIVIEVFDKILDGIKSVFGYISETLGRAVEGVMKRLRSWIVQQFCPTQFIKDCLDNPNFSKGLALFCILAIILVIDIIGFLSYKLATTVIDRMIISYSGGKWEAQGPEADPIAGVVTLISIVLGLCVSDMNTLAKRAREFTSLVAAGLSSSYFLTSLFLVLPLTVQTAMKMKFGTQESKDQVLIEDWLLRSSAVIRLKTIPKVLTSDEYYQWLVELHKEALGMKGKIKTPTVGNIFVRNLVSITQILTILENYRNEKVSRDLPYSLHICAPPGYGKTLFTIKFVKDVFGVSDTDIYQVPVASEFWDGYIGQEFVIMDEFLVGEAESKVTTAKQYLELVSTKNFKPPLASVDDPAVGLKGTTCSPIGVVTINNSQYNKVPSIPQEAIWRRREYVIEMSINEGYKDKFSNGKIDLESLTNDDIKNLNWLSFTLKSAVPSTGSDVPNLSYGALVTYLREHRAKHLVTCDRIRTGLSTNVLPDKSPKEMLEDTIRELRGVPNESQGLGEAIFSFFGNSDFESQGPGKTKSSSTKEASEPAQQGMNEKFVWRPKTGSVYKPLFNKINKLGKKISQEKAVKVVNESYNQFLNLKSEYDGVEPEFLEETKMMKQCILKLAVRYKIGLDVETSSDDCFSTASEGEEEIDLLSQKGNAGGSMIISNIDHSNVDPEVHHRHHCLGYNLEALMNGKGEPIRNIGTGEIVTKQVLCGKQFTHKHAKFVTHDMLCSTCKSNGVKQLWTAIHGGGTPREVITLPELLPEDMYYEYIGAPDDYKAELDKMWLNICIEKFLSHGTTPIVIMYDPSFDDGNGLYWEIPSASKQIRGAIINTSKWVAIFVIIYAIRKWFRRDKDMPDEITFGQSPPSNRETRGSRKARVFKSAHAQALTKSYPILEIEGVPHRVNPICGSTFLTYFHALFDDGGNIIPEGTKMKLKWGSTVDEFDFSLSMIQAPDNNDDLIFFTYPRKRNSQFPKVVKKFWTLEEAEGFQSTPGLLDIDGGLCYAQVFLGKNRSYRCSTKRFELSECLMYKYPTRKGDCGSLVSSAGTNFPNKFMGMHVAGGANGKDHFGLAIPIYREDVESALKNSIPEVDVNIDFENEGPELFSGPNLKSVEILPENEKVFVTRHSKLEKSCLSDFLLTKPKKFLPIMSPNDPRSDGKDPLIEMVNDSLQVEHLPVDEDEISIVEESLLTDLKANLVWPVGKRRLTIKEAIGGVPGKLASLKVKTSAGYPLCKIARKQGKTDFFYFDCNGELFIEPFFERLVEDYLKQLEDEGIDERRFVAYLKDELISSSKLEEKRCRIIYCGDLISNVAYRMIFGHILAAFNSSYFTTSSAIGLNHHSWGLRIIYDYLVEVGKNFVAGDFKNFDKRIHPQFQGAAYRILMNLCNEGITSSVAKDSFIVQQCFSSAQILDVLIKFKTTHFSGCFFTTIVNNLVNELYIRFCFQKMCPGKIFREHVRAKVLGDDHIYCFSDEVAEDCKPWNIREHMLLLGQVYTSDRKNEELQNNFRNFEEITFLGAHPVIFEGQYTGALKKDTLEETLHWTRNRNLTIHQEAKAVIELSSIWGKDYYEQTIEQINGALKNVMCEIIPPVGWQEMARSVCLRTAASNSSFPYGFVAQGPVVNSLAKLNVDKKIDAKPIGTSDPKKLSEKAVNEEAMKLEFGTDSNVFRTSITWKNDDVPEKGAIASFDVPFGILGLGDPTNLQNMPFDRFAYWKGDLELNFQINATPFQQGLAAAYFMPLASYQSELANVTTNEFVFIQPDQNATHTIRIPYKYLRSVMNTIARDTESLGTVFFTPISALSGKSVTEVTVTVYSAFPDSQFSIPRPVDVTKTTAKFYNTSGEVKDFDDTNVEYFAEGNASSTTNNYTFSNVGGDMPVQGIVTENTTSATQDIKASADVKMPMPFDNPPLCSGAVPIEQAFPGMAASHGVRPTRDMQLKPAAFSRQQQEIFNPAETKIETLLSKMTLLTKFKTSPSKPVDTELLHIELNTRLGVAEGTGRPIPINIGVLNQFLFWRADFEFTFISVQTQHHSMRLRAITQYAAPSVAISSQNTTYSSNMNFATNEDGTNYVHRELVPFNAQTEFLRTYQGESVIDPIQNYSLGSFSVVMANAMSAPDTVDTTVEICVFLRILNAKVAVPSPASPFTWNNYLGYDPVPSWIMTGDIYDPTTAKYLEKVSNTVVRVPRSSVNWIGLQAPDGTYVPEDIGEARPIVVFRDATLKEMRLLPPSMTLVLDKNWVTMTIPAFVIPDTFKPITSSSFLSLPRRNMVIRKPKTLDIPDIQFEAQGPEKQTTAEDIEEAPVTSVTKEEAPTRRNEVCKLEIGEKFEFCVTDVHEIGRRYIRMVPINNPLLDQFAVYSMNTGDMSSMNLNIPTQPQSHWRALYSAWAGGIKFRIFRMRNGNFPQIFFTPFYNQDVKNPSIPIIDSVKGIDFEYGGIAITSNTAITGPIAREVAYPIGDASYIDVSVPFQSHYNFCYNSQTQSIAPVSSGTLTLGNVESGTPLIFTAFADDLRLGIYRSPRETKFDMKVFTQGVGGFYNKTKTLSTGTQASEQQRSVHCREFANKLTGKLNKHLSKLKKTNDSTTCFE